MQLDVPMHMSAFTHFNSVFDIHCWCSYWYIGPNAIQLSNTYAAISTGCLLKPEVRVQSWSLFIVNEHLLPYLGGSLALESWHWKGLGPQHMYWFLEYCLHFYCQEKGKCFTIYSPEVKIYINWEVQLINWPNTVKISSSKIQTWEKVICFPLLSYRPSQ